MKLETDALFPNPDASFPNRPSELTEDSLGTLKEEVKRKKADFGAAFDGDGDRAAIVDDKGRMLSADQCGVIIAKNLLRDRKGIVLANVECSMLIERELEKLGGKIERNTGRSYFPDKRSERKKRSAWYRIKRALRYSLVIPV